MASQEKAIAQLSAATKFAEGKAIIGILDKRGALIEVVELEEDEVVAETKNMKEEEEKQFRERILKLCYSGIKSADYFINLYPNLFLTIPEQVKEDLYRIIYYFDNLLPRKDRN